ncbi:hypothetical protein A2U01_0109594, partial [Trifolium medium]|nr:hypothetical protein [Trifolium medium]
CAMVLSRLGKLQSIARRAGKESASRQQVLRRVGSFGQLRVAQEGWRVAPDS